MVPEGWSVATLEEISATDYPIRYGVVQIGKDTEGGIPIVPIKFINSIGSSKLHRASPEIEGQYANSRIQGGDVLLSVKGTIGRVGVVPEGFDCNIAREIARIRPSKEYDAFYVALQLQADSTQRRIQNVTVGTTRREFSIHAVRKFSIATPPLPEQKKIAQILSTWDQAITATERLLENSQQRKKGLMQQLLTGKKRLVKSNTTLTSKKTRTGEIPGDWEYPKIAQICHQVTNKNIDDRQYPVLACSKHYGFVDSLRYFKKRVYSEDLTGYRVIPRGCIGFPANHVEEGSIGLQNLYDYGLVSPIYVVARPDSQKVNADYLYAVLKTDHYRQIFSAATNASVDRRGSLRWKEFSQIHVPLPPLPEQSQIAEVLELATKEIVSLETGLDLLKQEKKALMQQLLTGKRRVNVETEAA